MRIKPNLIVIRCPYTIASGRQIFEEGSQAMLEAICEHGWIKCKSPEVIVLNPPRQDILDAMSLESPDMLKISE